MYYALPSDCRPKVERDPVWAYQLHHAPWDVPDAIREVDALAEQQPAPEEAELHDFANKLLQLQFGLSPDLNAAEAELVRTSRELAGAALRVATEGGDVRGFLERWSEERIAHDG